MAFAGVVDVMFLELLPLAAKCEVSWRARRSGPRSMNSNCRGGCRVRCAIEQILCFPRMTLIWTQCCVLTIDYELMR